MKLILIIAMFALPMSLNAGFWNKVEKAAEKIEDVNEKEEKLDRLNEASRRQTEKRRERKARKEQSENQRKMMENQMCMQYEMINGPSMQAVFKQDPTMKKRMQKQTELSINSMNIEYQKKHGKKYNYKKYCKK